MNKTSGSIYRNDPFELYRFIRAQETIYESAFAELKSGQKRNHWMWYIFPQIYGLGHSTISKKFALKSIEEARQYLNHSILGTRLLECAEAVFGFEGRSISEIFGYPDDLKFKSSMTLFAYVADSRSIFSRILDKYFRGIRDIKTLQILEKLKDDEE